ncbi:GNAT family N-acetyltransferase [Dactylosporangium sp. CA-092794]|uniref:GNAT family N-acetyltransferase n=1 Tax=Dactylosporangium sp. CA-092794 TaxID=3239929 RepID=UPI003D8A8B70
MLETDRLLLRRFRADDAPVVAAYRSDPGVARYQSWEAPFPLAAAEAFVAGLAGCDPRDEGWFQYALERRADGALIGDIGVRRHDEGRQAEIGFTLATAFQRRGYATEAVRRVVEYLLIEEGLHRVHASLDGRNARSAALLSRAGFRREGLELQSSWWKGEWTDDLRYAVLASEWVRSLDPA